MKMLSIIIPIEVSSKQKEYLIERLKRNIEIFNNFDNIEIIVVDSSKKNRYKKKISDIVCNNKSIYIHSENKKIFSAAKARNIGVLNSSCNYILFYDVDLVVSKYFLENLFIDLQEIEINQNKFFIYPCLYLTKEFTKKVEKNLNEIDFNKIKESYLRGYNDKVLYLAVNTSTILVNREHFINIGMYNENFRGHGYEDFDLIHRLYINYFTSKIKEDYLEDYKTFFPAEYRGFRKYFSYISLPNFFREMYTLHLWHPRPLTNKYYKIRERNQKFFLKRLKFDLEELNRKNFNKELSSVLNYEEFIDNLLKEHGYDKNIYCGFFKYIDNDKPNKNYNIKRKIRKFFLNPFDFFIDSYKNWIKKLS